MVFRPGRIAFACLACGASAYAGEWSFDAGADLRIRQELMENVPGLPDGGVLYPHVRRPFTNHMRFRPRVWGETGLKTEDLGDWRLYTRLADEFRWCPEPYSNAQTFPGELVLDNLFLEGKGLFNGLFDMTVGRRDLYNLYGLDHVFVDGTPGDGSRTAYGDIVQLGFQVTEEERLDFFFLHNCDRNTIRWGTDRSDTWSLTGYGGDTDRIMDDWGAGAIWSGKVYQKSVDYQIFLMDKTTQGFHRDGVSHPWTSRAMAGFKLVPHLNEEWSVPLEAMGQAGKNGDGDFLSGWSTYTGVKWQSVRTGWKPFSSLGFHTMSGDENAGEEDGGHHAWDPMWARGDGSEMFLYGTHYGQGWWSNLLHVKLTAGVNLGRNHAVTGSTGPMWAAAADGMGGDTGRFKGLLSQVRYDFPIWTADPAKGERFEIFGHVVAEFFNPGDYFETDKPAWFFRWQVDFKF